MKVAQWHIVQKIPVFEVTRVKGMCTRNFPNSDTKSLRGFNTLKSICGFIAAPFVMILNGRKCFLDQCAARDQCGRCSTTTDHYVKIASLCFTLCPRLAHKPNPFSVFRLSFHIVRPTVHVHWFCACPFAPSLSLHRLCITVTS